MAEILDFSGITRLDVPPDRVLERAVGKLTSVVLIGTTENGDEYFASSISDGADVLWALERAKLKLLQIVDGDEG